MTLKTPRDHQDRLAEEALIGASVARVQPPDPPTVQSKAPTVPRKIYFHPMHYLRFPFLASTPHVSKETFLLPDIRNPTLYPK